VARLTRVCFFGGGKTDPCLFILGVARLTVDGLCGDPLTEVPTFKAVEFSLTRYMSLLCLWLGCAD